MKKLIMVLAVALTACTGQVKNESKEKDISHDHGHTATTSLNNGKKWKADEPTKANVAAMAQVINDSRYEPESARGELHSNMQVKIDTLVKQCRMKGADHDALHVWLEKVIRDMKELKEENNQYSEARAILKKDIESFNDLFE